MGAKKAKDPKKSKVSVEPSRTKVSKVIKKAKDPKKPKVSVEPSRTKVSKVIKKAKDPKKPKVSVEPSKTKVSKVAKKAKVSKKSKVSVEPPKTKVSKVDSKRILKRRRPRVPKKVRKSDRGVVYLAHVPHGFYEKEMKEFFTQFGQVTAVRIPKSTRTGKYKGYAFVEFMFPDVAKIAAETMNNYLMYKKVVKAKYLPPEEQKPYAFKYPVPKVPLAVRRKRVLRNLKNRTLTEEESQKEAKRLEKCVNKKLNKLKKMGINYEFQVANSESTESVETTS